MRISVKVVSAGKAEYFRRIPPHGTFLELGEVVVMRADGNPVIISTSERHLLIAHTRNASAVDMALHEFGTRGILLRNIRMCIQMYRPGEEIAFIDQAVRAGLRHVWAASPIDEFLARAQVSIEEKQYVMFRRRD